MTPPLFDRYRDRIVATTSGLFSHGPVPLEHTFDYLGDPGLFGPASATWPILGDAAAFIGGIRALLVQAAHPEVAAGVAQFSRYREDPLGRLSRTSAFVTAASFGAMPEVEQAVAVVARAHRPVAGTSHRGVAFAADMPGLAAWVHNALTDSFLVAYREFGARRLGPNEGSRFVIEQLEIGQLLGATNLPDSDESLSSWIADHPALADSPGLREAVAFLRSPPLPVLVRPAYKIMFHAAAATLPPRIRELLGVRRIPGAIGAGRLLVRALRWALGSSPSWHAALLRVDAPIPDDLFRQPPPQMPS